MAKPAGTGHSAQGEHTGATSQVRMLRLGGQVHRWSPLSPIQGASMFCALGEPGAVQVRLGLDKGSTLCPQPLRSGLTTGPGPHGC